MTTIKTVGLIGAGFMGKGLGKCLLRHGFDVRVVANRSRINVEALVEIGAREEPAIENLAAGSDAVLLCLPSATIVEETVVRLVPALSSGSLLIDCSTTDPETARRVASLLKDRGIDYAEAPLTGGAQQAEEGVLGALVGAEMGAFERARPILQAFCNTIEHFGGPGDGQAAKLLNNYMVIGIIALVTETFDKARRAGIDWRQLYEVARRGSGDSGVMHRIFPKAFDGDYSGYMFSVAAAHKDMRYFQDWSRGVGGPSDLTEAVLAIFREAEAHGIGDRRVSELLDLDLRSGHGTART